MQQSSLAQWLHNLLGPRVSSQLGHPASSAQLSSCLATRLYLKPGGSEPLPTAQASILCTSATRRLKAITSQQQWHKVVWKFSITDFDSCQTGQGCQIQFLHLIRQGAHMSCETSKNGVFWSSLHCQNTGFHMKNSMKLPNMHIYWSLFGLANISRPLENNTKLSNTSSSDIICYGLSNQIYTHYVILHYVKVRWLNLLNHETGWTSP